jgi:hypothetical protein
LKRAGEGRTSALSFCFWMFGFQRRAASLRDATIRGRHDGTQFIFLSMLPGSVARGLRPQGATGPSETERRICSRIRILNFARSEPGFGVSAKTRRCRTQLWCASVAVPPHRPLPRPRGKNSGRHRKDSGSGPPLPGLLSRNFTEQPVHGNLISAEPLLAETQNPGSGRATCRIRMWEQIFRSFSFGPFQRRWWPRASGSP